MLLIVRITGRTAVARLGCTLSGSSRRRVGGSRALHLVAGRHGRDGRRRRVPDAPQPRTHVMAQTDRAQNEIFINSHVLSVSEMAKGAKTLEISMGGLRLHRLYGQRYQNT